MNHPKLRSNRFYLVHHKFFFRFFKTFNVTTYQLIGKTFAEFNFAVLVLICKNEFCERISDRSLHVTKDIIMDVSFIFYTEMIININWNKSIKQRSHFGLTSDE